MSASSRSSSYNTWTNETTDGSPHAASNGASHAAADGPPYAAADGASHAAPSVCASAAASAAPYAANSYAAAGGRPSGALSRRPAAAPAGPGLTQTAATQPLLPRHPPRFGPGRGPWCSSSPCPCRSSSTSVTGKTPPSSGTQGPWRNPFEFVSFVCLRTSAPLYRQRIQHSGLESPVWNGFDRLEL